MKMTGKEREELEKHKTAHEERWKNKHTGAHYGRCAGYNSTLHHHCDGRCVQPLDSALRLAFKRIDELEEALQQSEKLSNVRSTLLGAAVMSIVGPERPE